MLYFRKYLTNFLKHFFGLKEVEPVYCGKFQVRRYLGFAIATLQLFQHPENVKISILPVTLSQQKYYIFTTIWRIFKNFLLAARWGTWLLWLKISRAEIFWVCNGNVTTFPTSRKCKNLNFSLYNVPGEMLYFRKYLTNSPKTFLAARRGRWLLWLKISRAQIFWSCNGKITTFPKSRKCKNFNSTLYTVPEEMLYFRKYWTNSQKTFFGWKMMKVAIVAENFKGSDALVLQWQHYNFSNIQKM